MGLLPAVVLALIAYTGSFTRYIADDYCSANWARRFGLFRSVWYWYINWSGRFSAYAADWFVEQMGARNVGIVPPLMLAMWATVTVLAIYLFLRSKEREAGDWAIALGLGIVFVFTVFVTMPSIETTFYWWNGMRSYALPLMFLTLYAVLYQWRIGKLSTTRAIILGSVFSLLFCFANAGLGDVYAVTQLALLGVFLLPHLIGKNRRIAPIAVLTAGIAGTVLALVAIVLSPGNPIREAALPPHPGLIRLLAIAGQGYAGLLQQMVQEPQRVLAVIGGVLTAAWAGTKMRQRLLDGRAAVGILVVGLVISYGGFLPGSWGLSEVPPPRNLIVPLFVLLASLFAAGFVIGTQIPKSANTRCAEWALAVLAIVALNISAGIDIPRRYAAIPTYVQYAQKWDAVETQIIEAKAAGETSVTVPTGANWAGPVVFSDHPKNWLNQCASGYYGIEIIGRAP